MGSFAITYDDFSGGHYMGDKSASLPSNTWYGTNAVLNPQGELIPGSCGVVATFDPGSGAGAPYWGDSFIIKDYVYTYVGWLPSGAGSPSVNVVRTDALGNTQTYSISGAYDIGLVVPTYDATTDVAKMYYLHDTGSSKELHLYNFSTSTSSVIATVTVGGYNLVQYKSRFIVWSSKTLYYSNTTLSSFSASDYYELPSNIVSVIPRSNDLLVITQNGVYSMTGVLGSSITIQLITPANELVQGLEYAQATGRTILFPGFDARIYALIGATTQEIARLPVSAYSSYGQSDDSILDKTAFGVIEGGNALLGSIDGSIFVQHLNRYWVRMEYAVSDDEVAFAKVARPLTSLYLNFEGLTRDINNIAAVSRAVLNPSTSRWELKVTVARHNVTYPAPAALETFSGSPASASVQLSEYWHQKAMTVRELIVEAVYDKNQNYPNTLTGNASVSVQTATTGAIDYNMNQTSALVSSSQSYTTALADIDANESRALHRFFTNDAIRGYGFYPTITWQGCRIRRVIAICED